MAFRPVEASMHIVDKYRRYLQTTFRIADTDYNNQFQNLLNQESAIAKGPYLDISDEFIKDKTIGELVNDGFLSKEMLKLDAKKFPVYSRKLYKHQVDAIKKVTQGKNIVVSTGTGSGKTESFVIPILNHIMKEKENNTLGPGVRALLIYPMNALANDQINRFRDLLKEYPDITFGCYTGETEENEKNAIEKYIKLNNTSPKTNELISREKMRDNPPNILITNYAMLEYLLIRPGDNVFFSKNLSNYWQFVVLDEAHVYNGAKGIEVSMLLRRLKATVSKDDLQFILTSATLGDDNSNPEVASFATNLCGATFSEDDVIRGEKTKVSAQNDIHLIDKAFYKEAAELIRENASDIDLISCIKKYTNSEEEYSDVDELLYNTIIHDETYYKIKNCLEGSAKTVFKVADKVAMSLDEVTDFVAVATRAMKNGEKLFDARYHMFLRALEGAYITLNPNHKLFISRKEQHYEKGTKYKVYEAAICNYCNTLYIFGKEKGGYLIQKSVFDENDTKEVYLVNGDVSDENDDYSNDEAEIDVNDYYLCSQCGALKNVSNIDKHVCDCGEQYLNRVKKVKTKKGVLHKCVACESINTKRGVIRTFFAGQEAVTSVIGTALYSELPGVQVHTKQQITKEDEFGFGLKPHTLVTETVPLSKQFLAFSDSRQAAAFFASYLERSYTSIIYKRLIVEAAKQNKEVLEKKGMSLNRFVDGLSGLFDKYNIGEPDCRIKEAWKALLVELYETSNRLSLQNLGLLGFGINLNMEDAPAINLTKQEIESLFQILAANFRSEYAINYNQTMSESDKDFYTYNGVEQSFSLANKKIRVLSWVPAGKSRSNSRLDFITRVFKDWDDDKCRRFLKSCWEYLQQSNIITNIQNDEYKLDQKSMKVFRPSKWYICSKCKRITIFNVKNVCPSFKCDGTLEVFSPEEILSENHYRQMFLNMEITNMKIVEHTAQLAQEQAYKYQNEFKRKSINILSCSTTFEMGVDVGSLETVFMRNMPPSPANYAQRAGRAGRSKQAAAYALTFCNKSSHDLSYFNNPLAMIKGKIEPPRFNIHNDKIVIRHIYASTLAFFWRRNPDYFNNVDVFFNQSLKEFYAYLRSKPDELKSFLKRFVPDELAKKLELESFGWLESFIGDDGRLSLIMQEYNFDISIIQKAIDEVLGKINSNKYTSKETYVLLQLKKLKYTIEGEQIIPFLSKKSIIPKYGFPVDTVGLQYANLKENVKLGLRLERDLMMAISEYAPGSEIVADGKLITSRYIKKIEGREWPRFDYIRCNACQTLNIAIHTFHASAENQLTKCKLCGQPLENKDQKTFVIPQYGFIMDENIKSVGLDKPEKTFRGDISYIGYENPIKFEEYTIAGKTICVGSSRDDELAVLNESKFYICNTCGFGTAEEKEYMPSINKPHHTPSGYKCYNSVLEKYSLGHRFKTDVAQIQFIDANLDNYEKAQSVLYGFLEGISRFLSIERDDISGCLQWYRNLRSSMGNYMLVLFDTTPGGAGHVRRLNNATSIEGVMKETIRLMKACKCGGEQGDSSCYSCLRNYYNQRQHDLLKRSYVIDFIEKNFSFIVK